MDAKLAELKKYFDRMEANANEDPELRRHYMAQAYGAATFLGRLEPDLSEATTALYFEWEEEMCWKYY